MVLFDIETSPGSFPIHLVLCLVSFVFLLNVICTIFAFVFIIVCTKAPQRLSSDDQVRKIVKEEGRTARNLVTWNVPLEDQGNVMYAFW